MDDRQSSLPDLTDWFSSSDYQSDDHDLSKEKFLEVTDLLLENPNLNSSHLFRADILFDSEGILKTVAEKERSCRDKQGSGLTADSQRDVDHCITRYPTLHRSAPGRVVLRELIPRNLALDKPLKQKCLVYEPSQFSCVVVLIPDVRNAAEIPWYHPSVIALAYVYDCSYQDGSLDSPQPQVSLHFLPFDSDEQITDRLHRTFISLLNTFLRLCKYSSSNETSSERLADQNVSSTAPSAIKDTIIPQHIVQNTYSRLKQTYATDLISRWVESTEPSKHVFEDLSIAAFLIELWKLIYHSQPFPGFVDLACGNGVLVYVLLKEGYSGFGYDARRRKTWDVLEIDNYLEEKICVPKPFLDLLHPKELATLNVQDGTFPAGTFIISNHADELTLWTPLLAALSNPKRPLPFLAIPCCSHALSGARYRYPPKDTQKPPPSMPHSTSSTSSSTNADSPAHPEDPQPSSGDLRALRATKQKAANHRDDKSMYACLTRKVARLAEEVGFDDVEMTLMRIPSTRNIGVVGGMKLWIKGRGDEGGVDAAVAGVGKPGLGEGGCAVRENGNEREIGRHDVVDVEKVHSIIERECVRSGGIEVAARIWLERVIRLQRGKGRGKVNLGYKPQGESVSSTT
jgi:tRNASer (uridine44-2'-O)-methyltransferase